MLSLRLKLCLFSFTLALFAAGPAAIAHGVNLTYERKSSIEVTAFYDTGKPMSGAQVAVFSPADHANPWLTGTLDIKGRFFFAPDPLAPGSWEVRVSQAGHGGVLQLELGDAGDAVCHCLNQIIQKPPQDGLSDANTAGDAVTVPAGGFSTLQKLVMALAVLWGLTGTALFYSRRKS